MFATEQECLATLRALPDTSLADFVTPRVFLATECASFAAENVEWSREKADSFIKKGVSIAYNAQM